MAGSAPSLVKRLSYKCGQVCDLESCAPCATCGRQCPAGYYCPINDIHTYECPQGGYCPGNSSCVWPCPPGYFCPLNVTSPVPCPWDSYCRAGVDHPSHCNFFSMCPNGQRLQSSEAQKSAFITLVIALSLICIVSILKCRSNRKLAKMRAKYEERLQRLGASINSDEDEESPSRDSFLQELYPTLSSSDAPKIGFYCDGLTVTINGKKRLCASCVIEPRKFTAIMGGSGCGKTTLLNVFNGKAWEYGKVSGGCYVGHDELDPHLLRKLQPFFGFVPQEDVMTRTTTVRETIEFQAQGRLSISTNIEQLATEAIETLELTKCEDERIGDEVVKGISGGQRKRVNVGMELIARPFALLLDEPTSGLDSYTSLQICKLLKHLTRRGVTVIAVIHQPRPEIFEMLDRVVILSEGSVVYSGPPLQVETTYLHYGLPVRHRHQSVADYAIDCVTPLPTGRLPGGVARMVEHNKECENTLPHLHLHKKEESWRTFFCHLKLYLCRNWLIVVVRQPYKIVIEMMIAFFGATMLSAALPYETYPEVRNQYSLACLLLCLFCHFASISSFGPERAVFQREASSGFSVLAYFIGKDLVYSLKSLTMPTMFIVQYATIDPHAQLLPYWMTMIGVAYASIGSAELLSVVLPQTTAQIAAVLVSFANLVLSGSNPSLTTIWDGGYQYGTVLGGFAKCATSLSALRWGLELLSCAEWERSSEMTQFCFRGSMWDSGFNPDYKTFAQSSFPMKLAVLFFLGFGFRILAVIALYKPLHAINLACMRQLWHILRNLFSARVLYALLILACLGGIAEAIAILSIGSKETILKVCATCLNFCIAAFAILSILLLLLSIFLNQQSDSPRSAFVSFCLHTCLITCGLLIVIGFGRIYVGKYDDQLISAWSDKVANDPAEICSFEVKLGCNGWDALCISNASDAPTTTMTPAPTTNDTTTEPTPNLCPICTAEQNATLVSFNETCHALLMDDFNIHIKIMIGVGIALMGFSLIAPFVSGAWRSLGGGKDDLDEGYVYGVFIAPD